MVVARMPSWPPAGSCQAVRGAGEGASEQCIGQMRQLSQRLARLLPTDEGRELADADARQLVVLEAAQRIGLAPRLHLRKRGGKPLLVGSGGTLAVELVV